MRKIDWTAKLTSRKFWAAIATFVSMMIVAIGKSEETATQVTALIKHCVYLPCCSSWLRG